MKTITALTLSAFLAAQATAVTLDGSLDVDYGAPLATDPSGDLASPGPADWQGVAWTDLTALYATNDATYLYVFISSPLLDQDGSLGTVSEGSYGLAIDVNGSSAGGPSDPWGNAITFTQLGLPDFAVRGNVNGDQWTELLTWDGSAWTGFATNWGGIGGADPNVALGDDSGVELRIALADLGLSAGDTVNLFAFATQSSGSKGAYDTVPADDQSTGWDDSTTQAASVAYLIVPEPASLALCGIGGLLLASRCRRATA